MNWPCTPPHSWSSDGSALGSRVHKDQPPSAQEESTLSRRREHKSFISKPLESKTQFIALADGRVTGLARRISRPAVPRLLALYRPPASRRPIRTRLRTPNRRA